MIEVFCLDTYASNLKRSEAIRWKILNLLGVFLSEKRFLHPNFETETTKCPSSSTEIDALEKKLYAYFDENPFFSLSSFLPKTVLDVQIPQRDKQQH